MKEMYDDYNEEAAARATQMGELMPHIQHHHHTNGQKHANLRQPGEGEIPILAREQHVRQADEIPVLVREAPQMEYQWAPAMVKIPVVTNNGAPVDTQPAKQQQKGFPVIGGGRDDPTNTSPPPNDPAGAAGIVGTIVDNTAGATPVQEANEPMLAKKAMQKPLNEPTNILNKQAANIEQPAPLLESDEENDDEYELTLKRLDERAKKAKFALVKIQEDDKAAALAAKKNTEAGKSDEKTEDKPPANSEAVQHQEDDIRVTADNLGDSDAAGMNADATENLEGTTQRLSEDEMQKLKDAKIA